MRPDIEAALERAEKATPPPWEYFCRPYFDKELWIVGPSDEAALDGNKHYFGPVNQEFACHARTDLPAIAVYALELEGAIKTACAYCGSPQARCEHYRLKSPSGWSACPLYPYRGE